METGCIFCEVRNQLLCIIWMNLRFKRATQHLNLFTYTE